MRIGACGNNEIVFQLSKLTSKINEAFIELDVPARDASAVVTNAQTSNVLHDVDCWRFQKE